MQFLRSVLDNRPGYVDSFGSSNERATNRMNVGHDRGRGPQGRVKLGPEAITVAPAMRTSLREAFRRRNSGTRPSLGLLVA
jgi:hypothetical protein